MEMSSFRSVQLEVSVSSPQSSYMKPETLLLNCLYLKCQKKSSASCFSLCSNKQRLSYGRINAEQTQLLHHFYLLNKERNALKMTIFLLDVGFKCFCGTLCGNFQDNIEMENTHTASHTLWVCCEFDNVAVVSSPAESRRSQRAFMLNRNWI